MDVSPVHLGPGFVAIDDELDGSLLVHVRLGVQVGEGDELPLVVELEDVAPPVAAAVEGHDVVGAVHEHHDLVLSVELDDARSRRGRGGDNLLLPLVLVLFPWGGRPGPGHRSRLWDHLLLLLLLFICGLGGALFDHDSNLLSAEGLLLGLES